MEKQQNKRILYLDIARGLAVLFMFTQHCMIVYELNAGDSTDILSIVFVLLGTAPAAPVFMLILGIFLMRSKAGIKKNIIRGFKLIGLGFLLNLLRFSLPMIIAGDNQLAFLKGRTPLDMLFAVDIFYLAGLSIVLCSLIKKPAADKFIIPFVITAVLIVSPFLWGRFGDNFLVSPFWGNSKNVYFPLFPWIIYPLLGMYLCRYLTDIDQLNKNLKKLFFLGTLIFVSGFLLFDLFPAGDYFRSGAAVHLLIIGFIFIWLAICYLLTKKTSPSNIISKTLIFWSKNVTVIYFVQWIIFGWSILILGANKQNSYTAALTGFFVLVLTHFSVKNRFINQLLT